jgi:hypothetical protein
MRLIRHVLFCLALLGMIAGALASPAAAKRKPVATTLYLHGTEFVGESEAFLPVAHEGFLTMDPSPPSDQEKMRQITNYSAGPNARCAGNNLFPTWIGQVSGKVAGNMKFVFTSIGTPGLVDINVWADVPGGADYCNEGYVEPQAQALGVALPSGEADVEAVLETPGFQVTQTLLVQVSPSTMDVAGTQRPGSNVFVSRIEYDSKSHSAGLSFSCIPPRRKASCAS